MVNPGDLILGDDDGMVIVERAECEVVLAKSLAWTEAEEKKAVHLAAGVSSVEFKKLAPGLLGGSSVSTTGKFSVGGG